jgi:hypothetical protein
MQRIMPLCTTEAETIAAVQYAQEMLYTSRLITSFGLKIKLLIKLEINNKRAIDLLNSWSISGRTKHMEVCYQFLQELKEKGILKIKWIPRSKNNSDLFTKNLDWKMFEIHMHKYCGNNKYMKQN